MTNTDDMVREGERLVDQHKFEEAIALFKQVIEIEGPKESNEPRGLALYLAIITREEQQFAFLNKLIAQYPDAPGPYIHRIKLVMRSQILLPEAAVFLCCKTLEKFEENQHLERKFRSMRLAAAMKARLGRDMAGDFIFIWQSLTVEKARPHFVQHLLEISDPKLASVFSTLIESGVFSEEIQQLFQHKLEQLALFEKVFPPETASPDEP